jgi:transposase-like protein
MSPKYCGCGTKLVKTTALDGSDARWYCKKCEYEFKFKKDGTVIVMS